MGEIRVEADKFWGAQTQRSLENFRIGTEKMPPEVIRAFAGLKKAAALTNLELGNLEQQIASAIVQACDEILQGRWDDQFPLAVWQTGSGTQTNMNVNEVIANRANQILEENAGQIVKDNTDQIFTGSGNHLVVDGTDHSPAKKRVHPNDHVNMGQSSNDTFPTAMHMAAVLETEQRLFPAIEKLSSTFRRLSNEYEDVIKVGRTHLQDAVPISFGQEISGWLSMLTHAEQMIRANLEHLRELAIGGTAVGTGLNTHLQFGEKVAERISEFTGSRFVTAQNKFHALTSLDGMVAFHGALKALAADLFKIANDVRWLASGPRSGIGEIKIPENEPGSSIMPGKVNPTQCEALTMVCCQVMANDTAVGIAASQGNFQLNVFLPVTVYNVLQSIRLLSDGMVSFNDNCAAGIRPNRDKIKQNLERSLMLVTALSPRIGYDNAAAVAKKAYEEGITLKEAAVRLGLLTESEFDQLVDPAIMV
jgi:fumarate hydratase class II